MDVGNQFHAVDSPIHNRLIGSDPVHNGNSSGTRCCVSSTRQRRTLDGTMWTNEVDCPNGDLTGRVDSAMTALIVGYVPEGWIPVYAILILLWWAIKRGRS